MAWGEHHFLQNIFFLIPLEFGLNLQTDEQKVISSRFDQTVSIVHLKGHGISAESQVLLSHIPNLCTPFHSQWAHVFLM